MKKRARYFPSYKKRQEKGAIAIEFAALFLLFFTVLYAIISFTLPMLLTFTFKHLSAEGARAALRVDPSLNEQAYIELVSQQVTQTITSSWLPDKWYDGNCQNLNHTDLPWQQLPAQNGYPSFGYLAKEVITSNHSRYLLLVCIQRKYNRTGKKGERAIIPIIQIGEHSVSPFSGGDGNRILKGHALIQL
ncbi:TadE/TadG family type IV pilus assembly protein [uncultured Porticoccus sp.]|uniref:TadE/TadG family type IV pilus assembly protein n=1 Tax=uncultured Porticoccus sp. TaxID=1256050 RepID=UPI0026019194|nr:TadE/TadG family type IV pilus assembly protein [uncultured Porticoccus sp.]